MSGHIRKVKRKTGFSYQARIPNPSRGGTSKIERTFRTKREAEVWITQQRASVLDGTWADPKKLAATFEDVVDAWRETWSGRLELKTTDSYNGILRKHLLPEFGNRKAGSITHGEVQRFIARLTNQGVLSGQTIRGIYAAMRAAMNAGVRAGIVRANPCSHVRLPRPVNAEMLCLSADEVALLADTIDPHYRTFLYVAAYTGLRAGELAGLRRSDVDPLRGRLYVRRAVKEVCGVMHVGDTKNHKTRSLVLPAFLREMLAEHMTTPRLGGTGPDAPLFPGPRGAILRHHNFYQRVFKVAVRRALPDKAGLRFHDLRHTCVALLIEQGAHPKAIQMRLGHQSVMITMDRYGHLLPGLEDSLADGLDRTYQDAQRSSVAGGE